MLNSLILVIRETLSRKPWMGGLCVAVILAIALFLAMPTILPGCGDTVSSTGTRPFFTTDEGATRFVGDSNMIPPIMKDGKPAVQALVFTCDGGKTTFVGYLAKYDDKSKAIIEKAASAPAAPKDTGNRNGPPMGQMAQVAALQATARLVKKPGDSTWLSIKDGDKYRQVITPKCPDGHTEPDYVWAK